MKGITIISTILMLGILSSCMAPEYEAAPQYECVKVDGLVVDENEKPINHIKIKMEWDSPCSPIVVYSSPKGTFSADLEFITLKYPMTVSVEISDIDGEENGGLFETKNDGFTIMEENYSNNSNAPIVYRLTRATASECSPQSL